MSKKCHFWHHFLKVRSPPNIFEMPLKVFSFTTKVIVYSKNRRRGASLQGCGGRGSPRSASYGFFFAQFFPGCLSFLSRSVCSTSSGCRAEGFWLSQRGLGGRGWLPWHFWTAPRKIVADLSRTCRGLLFDSLTGNLETRKLYQSIKQGIIHLSELAKASAEEFWH